MSVGGKVSTRLSSIINGAVLAAILLSAAPSFAEEKILTKTYTLKDLVEAALANNPGVRASTRAVDSAGFAVQEARAQRLPQLNLNAGASIYRYAQPITPIEGSPLSGTAFPEFDNNIYDVSVSFAVPLYRGGRIERSVTVAELKKGAASDRLAATRQELIYNIASLYYKTGQLDKLLQANIAIVEGLEEQKKNIEAGVNAGTAARVDLLKTEVELAHARQSVIAIENNRASVLEAIKKYLGLGMDKEITISGAQTTAQTAKSAQESLRTALERRPDYEAALKKKRIAKERVMITEGKRLPQVSLNGEYGDRAGDQLEFKENWFIGLRLTLPVFDGGLIRSEAARERVEEEIAADEERALRDEITREVRDAYLSINNSSERVAVTEAAIEAAKEGLRIEELKYSAGEGTVNDVLAARAALLRSEADYRQALFERAMAHVSLKKAAGVLDSAEALK